MNTSRKNKGSMSELEYLKRGAVENGIFLVQQIV